MTKTKITVAVLSVLVLVGAGIFFAILYWPDDAYDAGYGRAYEQAWSTWMLKMPPPGACDQLAHEVLARDAQHLIKPEMGPRERFAVIDRIRHGCESGFYDGVVYRRGQLGLSPP